MADERTSLPQPAPFQEAEKQPSEHSKRPAPGAGSDDASSHHSDEVEITANEHEDPEDLCPVPSNGPVYSVFSTNQKRFIVSMAAFASFFSPLSASIYFPALNTLSAEFNVSETLINLTLTTYMIFQGLAPTFFGDFADQAGRRPAYALGFIIYLGANIGLALQDSYAALLTLRMLQSFGSSSTIALGSGVVADIATSAERGVYMGWVTSGPMIAPALGPVLGGIMAQFLGWRWIFWFLVILSGTFMIPFFTTFPETGRNVVGNGSIAPQGWNMSLLNYLKTRKTSSSTASLSRTPSRASTPPSTARKLRFPNPLHTLHVIFEKDVGLMLLYNAIIYTAFYDVIASIPYLFALTYSFNDLQIGLCFLPYGLGGFLAPILFGRAMDWNYRRIAKKVGFAIDRKRGDDLRNFPIERTRFQVAYPLLAIGTACIFAYGWAMQARAHLAVPLVLQFLMGLTLTGAFNVLSVTLIDLYPLSPATATAANNLCRCFMGAAGTGVVILMIEEMGTGWCFTFVGAVVVVTSPVLWVLTRWGPGWREERRVRVLKGGKS